ncbi:thioredoxin family protein [Peribacillus simplex]|uniref:thioredoxin family protein n=1 Tax=Peribacillus TaxID=2675229 RepID=UPI001E629541|nr:thioredoxin family protein [Brevibacillus sp. JNUCC-41]
MGSAKSSAALISLDTPKLEKYIKEKENFWVYIGRPTCDECDKFSPVLNEVLKENNIQVYYYNTDKEREENEKEMVNQINKLGVKTVPTMINFKKGKVIKTVNGYQNKASLEKLLKD